METPILSPFILYKLRSKQKTKYMGREYQWRWSAGWSCKTGKNLFCESATIKVLWWLELLKSRLEQERAKEVVDTLNEFKSNDLNNLDTALNVKRSAPLARHEDSGSSGNHAPYSSMNQSLSAWAEVSAFQKELDETDSMKVQGYRTNKRRQQPCFVSWNFFCKEPKFKPVIIRTVPVCHNGKETKQL